MIPHIDSIAPDHGLPSHQILIQGSGFRPNDTYVRAVMFRYAGEDGIRNALFSHVVEDGVIRDDRLIATVPTVFTPGGAYVWVENIELLPPAPWEPKPGEIEPHDPPPPQYHLFRSNEVLFIVDCINATRVTEATMPDAVRDAVETDLLTLQADLGGRFPVTGLKDYKDEGGECFGIRTKDLKAWIRFDTIETSWSGNDLWTITVTATIRATAKIDTKVFLVLCQWVRFSDMEAGGGGHRWDFTVSTCSKPCTATTPFPQRTLELHYVSSAFHLGSFPFDGVPNWAEGDLRDHVAKAIRKRTLGANSPFLSFFDIIAEKANRLDVGGDCAPLDGADICAALNAVSMESDRDKVLEPLRAFRPRAVRRRPDPQPAVERALAGSGEGHARRSRRVGRGRRSPAGVQPGGRRDGSREGRPPDARPLRPPAEALRAQPPAVVARHGRRRRGDPGRSGSIRGRGGRGDPRRPWPLEAARGRDAGRGAARDLDGEACPPCPAVADPTQARALGVPSMGTGGELPMTQSDAPHVHQRWTTSRSR